MYILCVTELQSLRLWITSLIGILQNLIISILPSFSLLPTINQLAWSSTSELCNTCAVSSSRETWDSYTTFKVSESHLLRYSIRDLFWKVSLMDLFLDYFGTNIAHVSNPSHLNKTTLLHKENTQKMTVSTQCRNANTMCFIVVVCQQRENKIQWKRWSHWIYLQQSDQTYHPRDSPCMTPG